MALAATGCASSAPPAACAPVAAAAGAAPDDLEHQTSEQLARRVMELTGAGNLGKQMAAAMAEQLKKLPNTPPGFMDRFMANIHPDELTDLIVPIYVKELDHDTLVAVVRFYETPAGKTLVTRMPVLLQESTEAGKEWGRAIGEQDPRGNGKRGGQSALDVPLQLPLRRQPGRSSGRFAASLPCSTPVDWPTSIRYPSGSRM
jgi:hypothetical protein